MITFLAPYALFATALLAIPVILHLFKPRKVRRTPFSSLRWLHLSQQKLARRIKWHQVILFLLRAAFIALLVLALARPVLSPRGSDGRSASVDRFVVLDVSLSMGYQATGRPAPIELARQVASDIVRNGLAGDRTAILLTDSTTRVLGPLSSDPNRYLAALKTVEAGANDTDLGSALEVIRPMLSRRRAGAAAEIHIITDNYQGGWRHGDIASFVEGLDIPITVRVVDVGIAAAANAWIAEARTLSRSGAGEPQRIRVQVGGTGDVGTSRIVRLSGLQGLPEITRKVELDPGNLVQAELELPAGFDARGQVARVAIEPGDGLPDDDVFFLDLDPPASTRVLLIEADTTRIEAMRPGFYLRTALEALSAANGEAIEVVSKSSHTVAASDFDEAGVILFADVPSLPDDALASLEARVKSGGGLAIFLGPGIDPAFYNNKLYRPLLPSEGLMPAPLGSVANAAPQRLDSLTHIDWAHPLLAPLYDPVLGDFQQVLFRSHYQFGGPAPDAQVLASIGDRAPAILDRGVGAGQVVVFNTSAGDAWSDLPRRKSFVPLIDRLLSHLSGGAATVSTTFEAGQIITLPMPNVTDGAPLTVTAPDGKTLTPTVQSHAGQSVLRLDGVQRPGIYRVEAANDPAASRTFIVQAGRGDSTLSPIDAEVLKKWWEPLTLEVHSADAAAAAPAVAGQRVALWPWLVGLACLAFLAEMFLVHWLCPRMNPGVVAPVVPRRGLFSIRPQQQQQQEITV